MSLQVWLPLNGDLQNKGLSDISVTNNGATVDNNGKIEKCYNFNGTNNYLKLNNITCAGWTEFSLTCWCYPINSFNAFFLIRGGSAHRVKINNSGFTFRDNHHSAQTTVSFGTTIPTNTWSHLICIYNQGKISIYINGILTNSQSYYYSDAAFLSDLNEVRIARQQSSSDDLYYTGKLNDFRIYDHALSLKEVKEISKALVLHYPLNNNELGHPNLILQSYYNIDPWASAISQKYINFKDKTSMIFNIRTIYQKTSSGTTSVFPQMTFKENTIYTFSGYYNDTYRTDGKTTGARFGFTYTDGTVGTKISLNSFVADSEGWKFFKIISTQGKSVSHIACSYDNAGLSVLAQIKIEEGNTPTSFAPGYNESIIYDCSGYQYNGTLNGTFEYDINTSRYLVSQKHTGTNYISLTSPCAEIKTISLWVKWDTIPSGQSVVFVDYKSKIGFGLMSTGILCSTSGAGNSKTFSKANIVANTWYHFVIINPGANNSTDRKLYINGIEQTPTTNVSNWTYSVDQLQIGKRSTTSDGFVGCLSDFRAYATVLSEDDILELYHTSTMIDKNQNVYTREIRE